MLLQQPTNNSLNESQNMRMWANIVKVGTQIFKNNTKDGLWKNKTLLALP